MVVFTVGSHKVRRRRGRGPSTKTGTERCLYLSKAPLPEERDLGRRRLRGRLLHTGETRSNSLSLIKENTGLRSNFNREGSTFSSPSSPNGPRDERKRRTEVEEGSSRGR